MTGKDDRDFRLFLERSDAFSLLLLDEGGRIVYSNPATERITGFAAHELRLVDASILYSPEEVADQLPARALDCARELGTYVTRSWRVRRDKTRFWALDVITAIREQDHCSGFGRLIREIPEIAERDRELRDLEHARTLSERLNRAVLSSLRAHIAVLHHDGTVVKVNEAWERFAREYEDSPCFQVAVGGNYLDACRKTQGSEKLLAHAVMKGVSGVLNRSQPEFTLEYQVGSASAPMWFLLSATPLDLDSGGAVVSHTNITERVLAEQNLQRSSAYYKALIENAQDVVTILDRAGTVRYESPSIERVLGYEQSELIGRKAIDYMHPDDVPRIAAALKEIVRSPGTVLAVEFQFRHKNGYWRTLEGIAKSVIEDPAIQGIVVNSRDVTDRRQAETELRETESALRRSHQQLQDLTGQLLEAEERERRRLSRELHDDLNQRIAVLAVDLGGVIRALPTAEAGETERGLRSLQSRLATMCEDVRVMAHQLHPSMLDELGLAVALRSYCEELARREGMQIRFIHRRLPLSMSQALSSAVYRIAQEALRNAAKHSGSSKAQVSVSVSRETLTLTVRDFGRGMAADCMASRRGLGLISMEERARLAGGVLELVSMPGKGMKVIARFPWKEQ